MIRTYRLVRDNWRKNYRYHGGVGAASRCLLGTLAVRGGLVSRRRDPPAKVDCLTFSVVPWMTALWARLLLAALEGQGAGLLIGDCSGGLGQAHRRLIRHDGPRLVPCLNQHHGEKLDLFLARLCRGPYVVVADDDVFWLDERPLAWALDRLEADPRVAAVSLLPRDVVSNVLARDGIERAMGSHCLVIRRDLWRRERLSFAVEPPPPGVDWFYDTGDFANRELLRRGYRVEIAPPEIEACFAAFDGVSAWLLKVQGHRPDQLAAAVAAYPGRQTKAHQAIAFARGLARLLAEPGLVARPVEVVPAERLEAAERVLDACLPGAERDAIDASVDARLRRVRRRLREIEAAASGARG